MLWSSQWVFFHPKCAQICFCRCTYNIHNDKSWPYNIRHFNRICNYILYFKKSSQHQKATFVSSLCKTLICFETKYPHPNNPNVNFEKNCIIVCAFIMGQVRSKNTFILAIFQRDEISINNFANIFSNGSNITLQLYCWNHRTKRKHFDCEVEDRVTERPAAPDTEKGTYSMPVRFVDKLSRKNFTNKKSTDLFVHVCGKPDVSISRVESNGPTWFSWENTSMVGA